MDQPTSHPGPSEQAVAEEFALHYFTYLSKGASYCSSFCEANDVMVLYSSVEDGKKATNLTYSMESFMPKVIPARLASKPPYQSNNQSRHPVSLATGQI
nr:hypothetical protein HmN_000469500 [Hymenolepis microstoma]